MDFPSRYPGICWTKLLGIHLFIAGTFFDKDQQAAFEQGRQRSARFHAEKNMLRSGILRGRERGLPRESDGSQE